MTSEELWHWCAAEPTGFATRLRELLREKFLSSCSAEQQRNALASVAEGDAGAAWGLTKADLICNFFVKKQKERAAGKF